MLSPFLLIPMGWDKGGLKAKRFLEPSVQIRAIIHMELKAVNSDIKPCLSLRVWKHSRTIKISLYMRFSHNLWRIVITVNQHMSTIQSKSNNYKKNFNKDVGINVQSVEQMQQNKVVTIFASCLSCVCTDHVVSVWGCTSATNEI